MAEFWKVTGISLLKRIIPAHISLRKHAMIDQFFKKQTQTYGACFSFFLHFLTLWNLNEWGFTVVGALNEDSRWIWDGLSISIKESWGRLGKSGTSFPETGIDVTAANSGDASVWMHFQLDCLYCLSQMHTLLLQYFHCLDLLKRHPPSISLILKSPKTHFATNSKATPKAVMLCQLFDRQDGRLSSLLWAKTLSVALAFLWQCNPVSTKF